MAAGGPGGNAGSSPPGGWSASADRLGGSLANARLPGETTAENQARDPLSRVGEGQGRAEIAQGTAILRQAMIVPPSARRRAAQACLNASRGFDILNVISGPRRGTRNDDEGMKTVGHVEQALGACSSRIVFHKAGTSRAYPAHDLILRWEGRICLIIRISAKENHSNRLSH